MIAWYRQGLEVVFVGMGEGCTVGDTSVGVVGVLLWHEISVDLRIPSPQSPAPHSNTKLEGCLRPSQRDPGFVASRGRD